MAVALVKDSRTRLFFGVCSRLISSRCLQASADTFKNSAVASGRRGKRAALGWAADVEEIRIRVPTKSKAGGRKSKKVSDIVKSRAREKRSTSLLKFSDTTTKSQVSIREGRPTSLMQAQASSDGIKRKARDRKSSSLLHKSDATNMKNEGREKRSASPKTFRDTTTEVKVRERSTVHSPKRRSGAGTGEREGRVKAVAMVPPQDREASMMRRRRAPEAVEWSASIAETMLLYKDDDILALNKPAGLAVHGGPHLYDDLSKHLLLWQYDAPSPPELAHRLDKDTSGVLLLTRHAESAKRMAKLFHDRRIIKKYWAITVGVPEDMEGSIEIPIGMKDIAEKRRGGHSMNRVVLRRDLLEGSSSDPLLSPMPMARGRLPSNVHMAHTDYEVISLSTLAPRRSCLLLVRPITGFKHQLRVHLADGLMCPVLGDYKFGGRLFRLSDTLRRKMKSVTCVRGYMYLHAAELEIPAEHCWDGKGSPLVIKAPPPPHFKRTAAMLGLSLPAHHK